MKAYPNRPPGRKGYRLAKWQPDLFAWADTQSAPECCPLPRAARIIAQRFALSPSIARLIAEHAGFILEVNIDA